MVASIFSGILPAQRVRRPRHGNACGKSHHGSSAKPQKQPDVYFGRIMDQCMQIVAVGATSERSTHHSLIRVAVLVISRCCTKIPEEARRALEGRRRASPAELEKVEEGEKDTSKTANTVICSLAPLYDAGRVSRVDKPFGTSMDGWSSKQVRQAITLSCVLLPAVPAIQIFARSFVRFVSQA